MTIKKNASRLSAVALSALMAAAVASDTSAQNKAPTLPTEATTATTPRLQVSPEEDRRWTVRLSGSIDTASAIHVINQLRALSAEDPTREITLRIHSGGGEVTAGLAIYDVMQRLPNDIRTVCEGQAQSMAFVLLAAGTPGKREVLPHCTLMAHQVAAGVRGRITDMRIDFQDIEKANNQLLGALSRHTGWSINQLKDFMQRDLILTPEEAIRMNFVDAVREPVKPPSPNRAPEIPAGFCDKPERSYISTCQPRGSD